MIIILYAFHSPFKKVKHSSFTLRGVSLCSPFIHPSWFTLKDKYVHSKEGWLSSCVRSFTPQEGWSTLFYGWINSDHGDATFEGWTLVDNYTLAKVFLMFNIEYLHNFISRKIKWFKVFQKLNFFFLIENCMLTKMLWMLIFHLEYSLCSA